MLFQLECSVEWTTDTQATFGEQVTTSFVVGLKMSQSSVHLTEGQDPETIQFTSSIPIGCEYKCAQKDTHLCTVEMTIKYPLHGNNEIAFLFGDNQESTESCGTSITVSGKYNIGDTLDMPIIVYPKDDGKYDSTQKVELEVQLLSANDLWNDITFNAEVCGIAPKKGNIVVPMRGILDQNDSSI